MFLNRSPSKKPIPTKTPTKSNTTPSVTETEERFALELAALQERVKAVKATKPVSKEAVKQAQNNLKAAEARKEAAFKQEVKARLDYDIPIVQVEKAGITSTSAAGENELHDVLREFTAYRKENALWEEIPVAVEYVFENDAVVEAQMTKKKACVIF
jgi:type I restriction enzyme M protein